MMKRSSVIVTAPAICLLSSVVLAEPIAKNGCGHRADSANTGDVHIDGGGTNTALTLLLGGLVIILSGTAFCRWQSSPRVP